VRAVASPAHVATQEVGAGTKALKCRNYAGYRSEDVYAPERLALMVDDMQVRLEKAPEIKTSERFCRTLLRAKSKTSTSLLRSAARQ
jgi:hypothetical protein